MYVAEAMQRLFSLLLIGLTMTLACSTTDDFEYFDKDREDFAVIECNYGPPVVIEGAWTRFTLRGHLGPEYGTVTLAEMQAIVASFERLSELMSQVLPIPRQAAVFVCPGQGSYYSLDNSVYVDNHRSTSAPYKYTIPMHEWTHLLHTNEREKNGFELYQVKLAGLGELLADLAASAANNDLSSMANALLQDMRAPYATFTEREIFLQVESRNFNNPNAPNAVLELPNEQHAILGPVYSKIGQIWKNCAAQGMDMRALLLRAVMDIEREAMVQSESGLQAIFDADPSLVQWNLAIVEKLSDKFVLYPCAL